MSATHLIDTNTAIFFFRGNPQVVARWTESVPESLRISAITQYELLVGATTSQRPEVRRRQLSTLFDHVQVIPFGPAEAEAAAVIRAHLQALGQVIGPLDTLIAATARCHHLTLVSNNLREFTRIPSLHCLDWTTPS